MKIYKSREEIADYLVYKIKRYYTPTCYTLDGFVQYYNASPQPIGKSGDNPCSLSYHLLPHKFEHILDVPFSFFTYDRYVYYYDTISNALLDGHYHNSSLRNKWNEYELIEHVKYVQNLFALCSQLDFRVLDEINLTLGKAHFCNIGNEHVQRNIQLEVYNLIEAWGMNNEQQQKQLNEFCKTWKVEHLG